MVAGSPEPRARTAPPRRLSGMSEPEQEHGEARIIGESQGAPVMGGQTPDGRTFVVANGAMGVADGRSGEPDSVTDLVAEPAKVMRIGSMIGRLLDEVKSAPLDDPSRAQLQEVYVRSVAELREALAPALADELAELTKPFTGGESPTDAELRVAHAQLVGWLEGLFRGIQTALVAQQVSRQQGATGPRELPASGPDGRPGPGGMYL